MKLSIFTILLMLIALTVAAQAHTNILVNFDFWGLPATVDGQILPDVTVTDGSDSPVGQGEITILAGPNGDGSDTVQSHVEFIPKFFQLPNAKPPLCVFSPVAQGYDFIDTFNKSHHLFDLLQDPQVDTFADSQGRQHVLLTWPSGHRSQAVYKISFMCPPR